MNPPARVNAHGGGRLLSPLQVWRSAIANRRLILDLTRRDISGRYRGSAGGLFWAFITPLLMLAIYSFVFGYIFNARWTAEEMREVKFPIVLFVGLIFGNLLSECLTRGPGLIVAHPNYVKKVVFPLEILPWVAVGTALFHALISVLVLLLAMLVTGTPIQPTALFLPLVFFAFVPMLLGLTWLLAALGVYLRDLQQFVGIAATALLFLAPVFYPRTMLAEQYRWLLSLNPLTFVVEAARDLVLWGQMPSVTSVAGYLAASMAVAWAGWCVFQVTRRGFADVL
ncbi:hypothetical protein AO715_06140 [Xanthomonas sp. Mitacek01]|nr:hypothetical protein AO715_06140 [Xanthomonas sp. Mitacek01]